MKAYDGAFFAISPTGSGQHIHIEKQDYFIDLVFCNYILKPRRKLKHKNNVLFAVEGQEAARRHYGDTQDISNKVLLIFDTERLKFKLSQTELAEKVGVTNPKWKGVNIWLSAGCMGGMGEIE